MTTLAQGLARFAADLRIESLPDAVRASVRQRVLDVLGVSLAAMRLDTSRAAIEHARAQGGAPEANAVGVTEALPSASAAFVNGVLAHSLDFDDTHLPSVLHPSASIVPAVLATAQATGATGAQAITAIAAGLEICVRLGMAGYDAEAGNSLFFERGQHATSICGAVAGAAASATLLGLDADGICDAIGIAASMGAGVIEGNRAGGTVKRIHCGIAARSAVTAAALAARGFTGPPTILEGRFGFFQAWIDGRYDPAPLRDGLGESWEIPRIFFKPYPANHFTHAGIDAALAVRARGITPDQVAAIRLGVPTPCVRTIGEPIDAKRAPDTGYQAQFSGPFTVVAGLYGGGGLGLGLDDFSDELARDPARRALMQAVTVEADAACDAIYPMQFPAVVGFTLRDGTEIEERVLTNRGGPDRPLSDAEIAAKFADNAARALDADAVAQIERAGAALEEAPSVDAVLAPATNAK